jgi:hypothetical protein
MPKGKGMTANERTSGNGAAAFWFHIGRVSRAVPECERSAMRPCSIYLVCSFLLVSLGLAGCSSVPRLAADVTTIPDGTYVPNPHTTHYAGSTIEVRGMTFSYEYFSDTGPSQPVRGTIRREGDHFVLERDGKPFSVWYLARVRGQHVLWSSEGFLRWQKFRKLDDSDLLYLSEEVKL